MPFTHFAMLFAVSLPQASAPTTPAADGLGATPSRVDVTHSNLEFAVRHFGITKIRGVFNDWSATIMWNEADVTKSTVAVVAKTASVDTRHERRDADLRGEAFFDSGQFPAIVFLSRSIERQGEGYVLHADLTVRGITRRVAVPFVFIGAQDTPRGERLFAAGSFSILRTDYDLAQENRLARSLAVVSDEVELEFDLQAVPMDPAAAAFNSRQRPSIGEEMARVAATGGIRAALERYEQLHASSPDQYNFSEREVITLAHRLEAEGKADDARAVADFMTAREPAPSWHVLTATLAARAGDRAQALTHLQAALELDPFDTEALAMTGLLRND